MKFPRVIGAVMAGAMLMNIEAAQANISSTDRTTDAPESSSSGSAAKAESELPSVQKPAEQKQTVPPRANTVPLPKNLPSSASPPAAIGKNSPVQGSGAQAHAYTVRTHGSHSLAKPGTGSAISPVSPGKERPFKAPLVERYLLDGNLRVGEEALLGQLAKHPKDDQARFGLGMLQFLKAVEGVAQNLYRYGLRSPSEFGGPRDIMPIPQNPQPQRLAYNDLRQVFKTFDDELARADGTLSQITDGDVQLPVHFGLIKLDLTGDGQPETYERFWSIYSRASRVNEVTEEQANQFYIKFDRGDVHWLRSYINVFMAICDVVLAYDWQDSFNRTAHLFFHDVDSPYKFLAQDKQRKDFFRDLELNNIFDAVALIHTLHMELVEPMRMESALHHLRTIPSQNRESWKWILAETDNDHEWLPNPSQTSVIPNVRLTYPMIESWLSMMEELRKLLDGDTLIPFWRGTDNTVGINLQKFFLMPPQTLDPVLLMQGTDFAPYLQHGTMTEVKVWKRVGTAFDTNIPGFAVWLN